jgi:hypothetical protein
MRAEPAAAKGCLRLRRAKRADICNFDDYGGVLRVMNV